MQPGIVIYYFFILLVIISIILKQKPILLAAFGLLAVGIAETKSFFGGIQAAFKGLLISATDFLPIILLIGLVVSMTSMLKENQADGLLIKPLLRVNNSSVLYWLLGAGAWILTLFLWPTPAITLLGAVILPILAQSKISPLALSVGLCIFGEGIGLSGDYIIQGAPSLMARAAGLETESVITHSVPLVLGGGIIAALIGYRILLKLNKSQVRQEGSSRAESPREEIPREEIPQVEMSQKEMSQKEMTQKEMTQKEMCQEEISRKEIPREEAEKAAARNPEPALPLKRRKMIAFSTAAVYLLAIFWLLSSGLRGDSAAAVTGGITIVVLILGTLIAGYRKALNQFVGYIQQGMRFSMEVFAPIVVISSFFLLGTEQGATTIFDGQGPGYLERMALGLSQLIALNAASCALIVIAAAVLGAMSGSGFSALPLVGGIAAALGKTAGLPVVDLAVLGQIAAIWTDALVIPWGFPAVVSAVTQTEATGIVRQNLLPWLAVLIFIFLWTVGGYQKYL